MPRDSNNSVKALITIQVRKHDFEGTRGRAVDHGAVREGLEQLAVYEGLLAKDESLPPIASSHRDSFAANISVVDIH